MAYEALNSLQQTLLQILQSNDHLTTHHIKSRIISIHDKAVVLQLNLNHFPDKETIREVANTSEEIIQYLFSSEYLSNCKSIDTGLRLSDQLGELAEELDSTVGDVVDYCKSNKEVSDSPPVSEIEDQTVAQELSVISSNRFRNIADKIKSTVGSDSNDSVDFDEDPNDSPLLLLSPPISKYVVVGSDEDILQMKNRLTSISASREILPIVGMGGIGKSTLARHIYDDPMVMKRFDIRAWVTVSQDYSVESILSQLLASVKGKVDREGRDSLKVIEGRGNQIYNIFLDGRYLIVMDDIWSAKAWHSVSWLFPKNHNGSCIILTTRLMDVTTYCTSLPVHMMCFLDDEQSWRLFHHKVFGDQDCPLELRSVGEIIVKGCGGLPLSIVTVAGLLSRIPRTPKLWQQIEVNDGHLGSILSLSYNHLPQDLRECFLYMAGFPQDYEIHVSELTKLWVAEGFLEPRTKPGTFMELVNKLKIVEESAEQCLEDLIRQSLVLVTSRKIDGKIKSCKLHSMVRDFCVRQAGQEKFLLHVNDYFPNPILRRHFLPKVLQNHHRLRVSWHDLHLKDSLHSSTTSIICIPQRGYKPKGSVENFSSLRVLHVLRRNDHSYWELGQVFNLISLTYLASNIPDSIVPPAIAKLQNLQTLIIYRSDVRLPVEIWSLRQLRHLIAFSFYPLPLPEGATLSLKNLQTLTMAANFVCSETMVKMILNIKKLGICYSEEKFGAGCHLYNLIHLRRLEKLKLKMQSSSMPHFENLAHSSIAEKVRIKWRVDFYESYGDCWFIADSSSVETKELCFPRGKMGNHEHGISSFDSSAY
ncbi:putative late blight resistance protein homolog R1B-16 [Salvia hispanica]|uniref:putative late blight resistance protein homolog R1B-16 n=1 Tax=Salvia hispanica TaxID=49212 RepID=UPI0020096997|nr:putative late blight resistance protein homolog R1B-16 [Salvia hispanica]